MKSVALDLVLVADIWQPPQQKTWVFWSNNEQLKRFTHPPKANFELYYGISTPSGIRQYQCHYQTSIFEEDFSSKRTNTKRGIFADDTGKSNSKTPIECTIGHRSKLPHHNNKTPPSRTLKCPLKSQTKGLQCWCLITITTTTLISTESGLVEPHHPPLSIPTTHKSLNSTNEPPSSTKCLRTQPKHWSNHVTLP